MPRIDWQTYSYCSWLAVQANLVKPGAVSNALTGVGKKLTDALPNAPDISNPKAAEGKPTISKLANNKPAFLSSFQVRLLLIFRLCLLLLSL